jgi:prepilin-type N-terminal cleavage/methylation domain-containing protein
MILKKPRSNTFKPSGFTLIEMIVSIIFIGIFATLALTRTQFGLSNIQEQIAIDQITNDIDLAKSMAFAKHDTITIEFSTSQESYSIYSGVDNARSLITDFPGSSNGVVNLDHSKMRDINIQTVNFNQQSEIQFLPLGDLKSGGSIVLNSKTITIEPITGKWSVN